MKHILLLGITLLTFSASSQQVIKGSISDLEGEVPFANVIIKNSSKGVLADENGYFVIEAKPSDTLQISNLGYMTKEVSIGNQKELQITLHDVEALDEVLVIGYSTKYKVVSTICCSTRLCGYIETVRCCEDSLNRNDMAERSKLFPNPSRDGVFNLKIPNDVSEVDVIVADLTGRIILETSKAKLESQMVLDLSQQPSGIYIINLSYHGKQITSKKAVRM